MKITVESVLTGRATPLPDGRGDTGIAKSPRVGPVEVTPTGLRGDEQGDPKHHGGPEKAIHHYARDHYDTWRRWVPDAAALEAPGAFGENISTTGLTEGDVCIGDVLGLGTAVLQVSQGRQPCWKLDIRLGRRGTARHMQELRCTGWYYRVLDPGTIEAGDTFELVDRPEPSWPLDRVLRALFDRTTGPAEWEAAVAVPTLSSNWRETFAKRLARGSVEDWSSRLR
ncbi:MOSC domain-containing protein [Mobilicoccus caccae]|uniref:Molybdenum cofactor sulfurase n=1 Tax=Mobilicoccus caccae TaxID=1859295 RepID=A0ABQ6IRQ4_9MICO|nr:MOSC domain-containing protein [Mobilicoccus caccae]GMA40610.1 molybdenum cofactor sulfurase [Mobilicoccus caccae]